MNTHYLLLIQENGQDAMPLGLEPRTLEDAKSGLEWQLQGGNKPEQLAIAKRKDKDLFQCIESGKVYKAEKGCYTVAAWNQFLSV